MHRPAGTPPRRARQRPPPEPARRVPLDREPPAADPASLGLRAVDLGGRGEHRGRHPGSGRGLSVARRIPVGAVIIDSPWQALGGLRLPQPPFRPRAAIRRSGRDDPRTFMTDGCARRSSGSPAISTPESPALGRGLRAAASSSVGIDGKTSRARRRAFGRPAAALRIIDFFSEPARRWWRGQLDRALATRGGRLEGRRHRLPASRTRRSCPHSGRPQGRPTNTPPRCMASFIAYTRDRARSRIAEPSLARPFADDGKPAFYAPHRIQSLPDGSATRSTTGTGCAKHSTRCSCRATPGTRSSARTSEG